MVTRPENHVTRARDALRGTAERVQSPPSIDRGLLEYLRRLYPERCRRSGETEREHERYAGKVELIDAIEAWKVEQERIAADEREIAEARAEEDGSASITFKPTTSEG